MAQIVAQFLGIIAPDVSPPSNMQELIPYILVLMVGVFLISAVFKVITSIVAELITMRRM